jgi:hypothetical protein
MQGEGLDHRSSPRVKATSPEAREKNRRVEIGIVDTVIQICGRSAMSVRFALLSGMVQYLHSKTDQACWMKSNKLRVA